MKIELWWIGKTKADYLSTGMSEYTKRLRYYTSLQTVTIPDVRNAGKLSPDNLKKAEAELVLGRLDSQAMLILLDEKGKQMNSVEFAGFLQQQMNRSLRSMVFLIGGAYGFDPSLFKRADHTLSLSAMTFSHQMVRLFFLEQLYRAFTIIHNEKYHNP
jgi:23S rRNA (pseudouridine1915-N3)-methyltransferase